MTHKRFTKLDRKIGQVVIRTEEGLIKEVGSDSRESLHKIVEAFTDGEVVIRFDLDGVLLYSPTSDPQVQHKLVFPFKLRTFYVSINWVQTKADLTKHVTLSTEEVSVD